jgi:acetyl esterase
MIVPMTYERGDTPLHPQVAMLLQTVAATRVPGPPDYNQQRGFDDASVAAFNAGLPTLAVEDTIAIPGPAGDMRAVVYSARPPDAAAPQRVVLHMHGGGFVIARPETVAALTKGIATEGEAVVVALAYRRAPEHPYPAALEDTLAAYHWLRTNAAEIGGDPARIALSGDSAGATLAAAAAVRLLDAGEAPPQALVLVSAWLDLTLSTPSSRRFGPDDPLIYDDLLQYWRGLYLPDGGSLRDPLVSPLFADVSRFPPACVVVGAIDPFLDEDVQFAGKMSAAGRDAELHVYDGMPHWFTMFPATASLTDHAQRIGAFLRRVMP